MKATVFIGRNEDGDTIPDEYLFERIRLWRNNKLTQSDWSQIADSVCDKSAWATYRQALRDLPASNLDPRKIELPIEPA
jgi:hypothetical protein